MTPLLMLIATAALGVESGWEPLPEGGYDYMIQIEPQLLDILKKGDQEVFSDVPSHIDVRRFRIFAGTGKLARVDAPNQPPAQPPSGGAGAPHAGGEPHDAGQSPLGSPPAEPDEHPHGGRHGMPAEHEKQPHEATPGHAADPSGGTLGAPGELSDSGAAAAPLDAHPAGFNSGQTPVEMNKPELKDQPERPWLPFVIAAVLLCCSLGANLYLGWIAWDARIRYREALSKFRPAPAA